MVLHGEILQEVHRPRRPCADKHFIAVGIVRKRPFSDIEVNRSPFGSAARRRSRIDPQVVAPVLARCVARKQARLDIERSRRNVGAAALGFCIVALERCTFDRRAHGSGACVAGPRSVEPRTVRSAVVLDARRGGEPQVERRGHRCRSVVPRPSVENAAAEASRLVARYRARNRALRKRRQRDTAAVGGDVSADERSLEQRKLALVRHVDSAAPAGCRVIVHRTADGDGAADGEHAAAVDGAVRSDGAILRRGERAVCLDEEAAAVMSCRIARHRRARLHGNRRMRRHCAAAAHSRAVVGYVCSCTERRIDRRKVQTSPAEPILPGLLVVGYRSMLDERLHAHRIGALQICTAAVRHGLVRFDRGTARKAE